MRTLCTTSAIAAIASAALASTAIAQPSEFLLIPWGVANPPTAGSGSIGMYSPVDGSYLGNIVDPDFDRIIFPNSAILGPDRLIYISDSVNDAVYRYNLRGDFVDEFVGRADGLCNVRGLLFDGQDLLVSNNPGFASGEPGVDREQVAVLRFGPDGTEKTPFIPVGSDFSAWDLHADPDGNIIVGDVRPPTAGVIGLYDPDGAMLDSFYSEVFPTQLTDAHTPGNYFGFAFSGRVTEFNDEGVVRRVSLSGLANAGQGVYALENGELLAVSFNAGIYRYNPANGSRIGTIRSGFGLYGTVNHASICWADLNADGVLNYFDVAAFLTAYMNQEAPADLAEPYHEFDTFDVARFLEAFAEGCDE